MTDSLANAALLAQKLHAITAEVSAPLKSKQHYQGFYYSDVTDVLDVVKPMLLKYRVMVVPADIHLHESQHFVMKKGDLFRIVVTYNFALIDIDTGYQMTSSVVMVASDQLDKEAAKAWTTALRNLYTKLFMLDAGDSVIEDEDENGKEATTKQKETQSSKEDEKPKKKKTVLDIVSEEAWPAARSEYGITSDGVILKAFGVSSWNELADRPAKDLKVVLEQIRDGNTTLIADADVLNALTEMVQRKNPDSKPVTTTDAVAYIMGALKRPLPLADLDDDQRSKVIEWATKS